MINLFHINNYNIDTSTLGNLLHGPIVTEFEENFASYVGAKYACSANSASSLLFLSLLKYDTTIRIPSTIPIVVPNIIVNTGNKIEFYDDVDWVGGCYHLADNILDSAPQVNRNQYADLCHDDGIMIFSFYPTKPIGSSDGGMIVSNDKDKIDNLRILSTNGYTLEENSWEKQIVCPGYKLYMNSIQCYIALENYNKLKDKTDRFEEVKGMYNEAFGLKNTSNHLYRINVEDRNTFMKNMNDV